MCVVTVTSPVLPKIISKKMTAIPSLSTLAVALKFLAFFILALLGEYPTLGIMAGQPDYMRFTFDASMFPAKSYYDYIVVGGGTASCPLAGTLSKSSYQVLALERGEAPSEFPSLVTQEGFLGTLDDSDGPDFPAQPFVSEDGAPNARDRVLGSCSTTNTGFYSRAHPGFFHSSGVSWDMALINNSFEWVERRFSFQPEFQSWQSAVRDGLLATNIAPYNEKRGKTELKKTACMRALQEKLKKEWTYQKRGLQLTEADGEEEIACLLDICWRGAEE
ncbi:(R)-mandelonitrile lyase-like [Platanthera guangdongensis]|uniref:(R)-mandelonitrile lyase-like n=1 Tax=Platanthera guangdongensis TaxID=2320717 RepID=A0ABR2MN05_9ASPA